MTSGPLPRTVSLGQSLKMNCTHDYDLSGMEEPCQMEGKVTLEGYLRVYAHSVICVVGLMGNILVIITYAFYKRAKSMTDVYLLNVAVADILFVLALPLIIYSEQSGWAMGNWSCKLLRGVYSVNVYSGILLLACISGDRYLAIVQARRSFRFRSGTLLYSQGVSVAVWAVALALSMPTFIYSERYETKDGDGLDEDLLKMWNLTEDWTDWAGFDDLGGMGWVDDNSETSAANQSVQVVCHFRFQDSQQATMMKKLVPSLQLSVGFCLPLLVMGFCYTSVLIRLMRARNFQRHKAVRVVLAVVVVFLVCHLPYNVALFYDALTMFHHMECGKADATGVALVVTESIAYLHCCLNPILYAFVGVRFRQHFRRILVDLWCLGKRYIQVRRPSTMTTETNLSMRRSVDCSANDTGTSCTL